MYFETAEVTDLKVHSKEMDPFSRTAIPSAFLILILGLGGLLAALINFVPTWEYVEQYKFSIYIYPGFFLDLYTLSGLGIQLFWMLIILAFTIILAVCIYQSKDMFRFGKEDYLERTSCTPIYWVGLLLGSTLLLEVIINLILESTGSDVSVPDGLLDMTLEESLFSFTEAGVWEEIVFRMLLFGIPMAIAGLICKQKGSWKFIFGGFGVSRLGVILMVITAFIFAYAHVEGWGLWKIFSVMLGGLAMGYLFMRFGIHASILFHLINDYLGVWGTISLGIAGIADFALFGLGLICIPLLLIKTVKGIKNLKTMSNTGFTKEEIQIEENNDSNLD